MLFSETKKAALESLLFVSPDPLTLEVLCDVLELDEGDVESLLEDLAREFSARSHGIEVLKVAGGWRFATKAEYAAEVEKVLKPHAARMSRASLETLAIVAYRQPITRAEIEKIRGVSVDRMLNRLMEKNLIQEVGRKQLPGRPILYGTTLEFLEYFGMDTLEELPPLGEAPAGEEPSLSFPLPDRPEEPDEPEEDLEQEQEQDQELEEPMD